MCGVELRAEGRKMEAAVKVLRSSPSTAINDLTKGLRSASLDLVVDAYLKKREG